MNEPTMRLLSLGAGVQSTTLLLLSARGELPKLDGAIFADTGAEPAAVYEHLDRLEREVAEPAGIPIHRVSYGNLGDDLLDPNRLAMIPAYTLGPPREVTVVDEWRRCPAACGWTEWHLKWDEILLQEGDVASDEEVAESEGEKPDACATCDKGGWVPYRTHTETRRDKGMLGRKCTQTYKLRPLLEEVRALLGAKTTGVDCRHCDATGVRVAPWRAKRGEDVEGPCSVCRGTGIVHRVGQPPAGRWAEQWIGFSTDEVGRVSDRGDTRYSRSRYPLLELDMSRTQCESYLRAHGWGEVAKSACVFCPYHGNREWRRYRDTDPESWKQAVEFDEAYRVGPGMNSDRYLHISCEPLAAAPIDRVQRSDWQQGSVLDAAYDVRLAEEGDPDGCSPWGCRSGEPVTP